MAPRISISSSAARPARNGSPRSAATSGHHGSAAQLGRLPAEDDEQGVVLSYGLFQRRFGGRRSHRPALEIGGAPFTIVGVLPETFRVTFPQQTAPGDEFRDLDAFIALPRGQQPPGTTITSTNRPAPFWIRVVARLAPAIPCRTPDSRCRRSTRGSSATIRGRPRFGGASASTPLKDKLAEGALVPAGAAGRGRVRAAHRGRKRGQSDARTGVAPDEGNSHPRRPRRRPPTADGAVPGRERRARTDRRNAPE